MGGRSQDNWSPRQRTENLKKTRSDQGASGLDQPGFLPSTPPPRPSPRLSCLSSSLKGSPQGAGGNPRTRPPHPPPLGISLLPAETSLSAAGGGERRCVLWAPAPPPPAWDVLWRPAEPGERAPPPGFPSTCWGVVFAPVLSSCSCSESLLATSLPAFYGSSAVTHADGSTSLVLGPPRSLFRGQHPDSVGSGVCTFKQLPWGF